MGCRKTRASSLIVSDTLRKLKRQEFHPLYVSLSSDASAVVLTVRDEEENAFLRKKLLPLKDLAQFVWLGLYKDKASELHTCTLHLC